MVVSNEKFNVIEISRSLFETRLLLAVRKFRHKDVGQYRCISKNSLGEVESVIRIYEIPRPRQPGGASEADAYDEDDEEDCCGSAEDTDEDPDGGNSVLQRGHMTHTDEAVPPVMGVFKTQDNGNAHGHGNAAPVRPTHHIARTALVGAGWMLARTSLR